MKNTVSLTLTILFMSISNNAQAAPPANQCTGANYGYTQSVEEIVVYWDEESGMLELRHGMVSYRCTSGGWVKGYGSPEITMA